MKKEEEEEEEKGEMQKEFTWHPGMEDFENKAKKKISKSKSRQPPYAKDELSKKILRHLTKHDRKKIQEMMPRTVKKNKGR